MATPTDAGAPKPFALTLLTLSAALNALLAMYQWMELVAVRGGAKAVCTLNEKVDCSTVWNSAFAGRVHELTLLPVAGLGLLWALTALLAVVLLVHRAVGGLEVKTAIALVKLWAALGFLTTITLSVAAVNIGTLCLTCLGTYLLVAVYAYAAVYLLPGPRVPETSDFTRAAPWLVAMVVPLYLLMLFPGQRTPKATETAIAAASNAGPSDAAVEQYFDSLPPPEKQACSDARADWQRQSPLDASKYPVRVRFGPADAPTRLVDFTDVLCPHCRVLLRTLHELKKAVPLGKVSVEPRYFPLDGSCNPALSQPAQPDPTSVRCLGAKAQICLENAPDYWELREKIFDAQESLTPEKVLLIASSGTVKREALEACIASAETHTRLMQDIEYAMQYRPDGTPLLLLNGRQAQPVGSFLFGMALSGADPQTKFFSKLPPPR